MDFQTDLEIMIGVFLSALSIGSFVGIGMVLLVLTGLLQWSPETWDSYVTTVMGFFS